MDDSDFVYNVVLNGNDDDNNNTNSNNDMDDCSSIHSGSLSANYHTKLLLQDGGGSGGGVYNPLETSDSTVTWMASLFNLTSTILGSGVLALPYAFSRTGYGLGAILIVFSAFTSYFSLHLLGLCGVKTGIPSSFYTVTDASVPSLTFLVDVSVITLCIGTAISYMIVIGGLMPQVMEEFGSQHGDISRRRELWILIGFCIVFPLCCPRKLEALRFTSAMCVCFVCLLTVLVLLYAVGLPDLDPCAGSNSTTNVDGVTDECVGERSVWFADLDTLRVFSIFIFAFSCQTNIYSVTNEIRRPSTRRYRSVMIGAVVLTTVLYTTVALAGYSTYGHNVQSNVLQSYPLNPLTSITRIMVCVLVAFTFPLNCQPARTSALALWHVFGDPKGHMVSEETEEFRYWVFTISFVVGCVGMALITDNFGVVLGLVGATGATIVQYVLPGISYYVLFKDEGPAWKRTAALVLFYMGLVICPAACVFIFI